MEEIKVLVVEDEMIIANTIVSALESFGYIALEPAITYSEAVERIEENKPDIGIFDIQLSGRKTGIDLARTVNEKYNFPFLFITSFSDNNTLNEVKEVHPSAFLVKPFNKEELKVAIELALYNYSLQTARPVKALNSIIRQSMFIKNNNKQIRIKICDIMYILTYI
ncbi:MAG: hypothetical protein DRI86_03785 [Bacteroidetes bacterium]|nr:MAG: hypothetical protein DRI86_03785 [Bacteroidota bacterium]